MKAAPSLLYLREEELTDGVELFFFAGRDFPAFQLARNPSATGGRAACKAGKTLPIHPKLTIQSGPSGAIAARFIG